MSLPSQDYEGGRLAAYARKRNERFMLNLPDSGIRGQNRLRGRISLRDPRKPGRLRRIVNAIFGK